MGEEVCAWIKLKEAGKTDPKEFTDFCQGQIAHFKIPRYVRIVEEFPLTVTGKVKKNEMRHISNELLKQPKNDIHEVRAPKRK